MPRRDWRAYAALRVVEDAMPEIVLCKISIDVAGREEQTLAIPARVFLIRLVRKET